MPGNKKIMKYIVKSYRKFAVVFLALFTASIGYGAMGKPNIILVMTDDQGYAPVGAHGHPWLRTPHMDELHSQSVRFDRFLMGSTCAPSRAGLMTGNNSMRNGVTHTIYERERLNLKAITLADVLKTAGYTSGVFGKWHLGDEEPYQPLNRGFDEAFIHGAGGIGQSKYPGSCADAPGNGYFDPVFRHNGQFVKTSGFCTDVLFKATLGWIQKVKDQDQPFFAYLSTNAPHAPFVAPPSYAKYYENLGFDKNAAGFYGMIEHIDMNLGVMVHKLEEWGLMENTVLIFTSDNGMTVTGCGMSIHDNKKHKGRPKKPIGKDKDGKPMFPYNAEMKGLKSSVDEGGVRVPFFVRWDGKLKPGQSIDTVANYIDLLPTLAELAGAELPKTQKFEGRSLVPLMFDQNAEWPDRYIFEHVMRWNRGVNPDTQKWKNYSVRSQRFRLVGDQLFDMEKDPGQFKDVSQQYPEVVKSMKSDYEKFWDEVRPMMINDGVPLVDYKPYHKFYNEQKASTGIPDWVEPEL